MPRLDFISDEDLEKAVAKVIDSVNHKINNIEKSFSNNVIDPFAVLFEVSCTYLDEESWRKSEEIRQIQKTLTNNIGSFHESVLGSIKGWETPTKGQIVDIINKERKLIAEIKNKYNTLNASGHKAMYEGLELLVMHKGQQYKDYTAYLVEIVPEKPHRYDFMYTPSDKSKGTKFAENPLIRRIDGYSFYKLVTGVENALEQLFNAIPEVISDLYPKLKNNCEFVNKIFHNCYHQQSS